MRRSRRSPNFALVVFLAGTLLTIWAASGAAAVSATSPKVKVRIDNKDILELFCTDPVQVGYKDGFCKDSNGGANLELDFDRGLEGEKFGFQPGSRYTFGKVMHIRNVWSETVDVFVRVEQEALGNLYQVLSVDLIQTDKNTNEEIRHRMFPADPPPPDGEDGTEKTIAMEPGETVSLSFSISVAGDWAAVNGKQFTDPEEDRFTLRGAVIVRVGIEEDRPGGSGRPRDRDVQPEVEGDEPPLAGPGEPVEEVELIDETPEAGPLPRTGGTNWPYVLVGLLMMGAGLWLYLRDRILATE